MGGGLNEQSEAFAKSRLQRLEELKAQRAGREPELQMICDYIMPRRDFRITKEPGATRQRKLMDITGMVAHERLAATLFGYMLSPHSPWTQPRLLEREPNYEEDAWFDHVSRRMHTWFSSASNTFRVAAAEDMLDITGFGSSIMWQDRGPAGPVHLTVPMRQCFWAENENGEIDTNYRVYEMSLRRALMRWPKSPGLNKMAEDSKRPESDMVEILHIVEPRAGGKRYAVRDRMPWRDVNILLHKTEVLDVGGHNRFKYNIGRFQRRPGDPMGIGAAWKALPNCKLASAMMEAWIRNAEKRADPPLGSLMPRSTAIDRRPGAVNHLNQMAGMMLRDPTKMLFPIEQGGDIGAVAELLPMVHAKIEQAFYVDWLTPGEGPQKTATEVYDLRDMRLRTMGPIVARLEHEKMNVLVEQTFEDLQAGGYFEPPPASLDKQMIGFEFRGPLAISQRQGEAESILRAIEGGMQLAQLDPQIAMLFKGESLARSLANSYGLDAQHMASPKEFEESRAQQRELENMQAEMAAAQTAAGAVRDGAQGLASLQAANDAGGQAA